MPLSLLGLGGGVRPSSIASSTDFAGEMSWLMLVVRFLHLLLAWSTIIRIDTIKTVPAAIAAIPVPFGLDSPEAVVVGVN